MLCDLHLLFLRFQFAGAFSVPAPYCACFLTVWWWCLSVPTARGKMIDPPISWDSLPETFLQFLIYLHSTENLLEFYQVRNSVDKLPVINEGTRPSAEMTNKVSNCTLQSIFCFVGF